MIEEKEKPRSVAMTVNTTVTFVCGQCGQRTVLPGSELPRGWRIPTSATAPRLSNVGSPAKGEVIALCSIECDDLSQEATRNSKKR